MNNSTGAHVELTPFPASCTPDLFPPCLKTTALFPRRHGLAFQRAGRLKPRSGQVCQIHFPLSCVAVFCFVFQSLKEVEWPHFLASETCCQSYKLGNSFATSGMCSISVSSKVANICVCPVLYWKVKSIYVAESQAIQEK